MAMYYFDTDDGVDLVRDDVGVQLPHVEAAKREASFALAEMAVDALPSLNSRLKLSIAVRDDRGAHVLRTSLVFEMAVAAPINICATVN